MVPTRCLRGPSPLKILLGVLSLSVLFARPHEARAQACNDSLPTGNLSNVINTYYPGVGTAAAAATVVNVDTTAIRGASTTANIVAGDMLLVIQMQDADFNTDNDSDYGDGAGGSTGAGFTAINDTGRYEYVVAQSMTGGAITIRGAGTGNGLLNSYATVARDDVGTTRTPQRTFQVVRVSRRATATMTSTLTASAWDGRTGGILAFDVAGALALNGATASLSGLGFRGGIGQALAGDAAGTAADYLLLDAENVHGRKGEGFACTPSSLSGVPGATGTDGCIRGDRARGAPGNGGGGGTDDNPDGQRREHRRRRRRQRRRGRAGRQLLEHEPAPRRPGRRGLPGARGTAGDGRRRRRGRLEQRRPRPRCRRRRHGLHPRGLGDGHRHDQRERRERRLQRPGRRGRRRRRRQRHGLFRVGRADRPDGRGHGRYRRQRGLQRHLRRLERRARTRRRRRRGRGLRLERAATRPRPWSAAPAAVPSGTSPTVPWPAATAPPSPRRWP